MIVCSYFSVYRYLSRLFKCFVSKFYKMILTFRIEFKVIRNLCNLFLILVQCAILFFCSNIQSSIIILVINYELVSDPFYVTYLTFDLDLFYLFSILTFDLDLKNGEH